MTAPRSLLTDGDQPDDVGPLHPALPLLMPGIKPTREQIDRLEAAMLAAEGLGFAPPAIALLHHHGGDLYAREVRIPAGTVLTGLAHKHAHLNIAIGDISVMTEHGMQRLTGVHVVPSEPGARRAGYAHADTTWISIHHNPTGTTDPDDLAELFVEQPHRLMDRRHTKELPQWPGSPSPSPQPQ